MVDKILHRKLKIEQHEVYYNKTGMNSGASDGPAVTAPPVKNAGAN